MRNETDERILKLWKRGVSIPSISRKIGRPGDHERVRVAIMRDPAARQLAIDRGIAVDTDEDGCFTLPNGECVGENCPHSQVKN